MARQRFSSQIHRCRAVQRFTDVSDERKSGVKKLLIFTAAAIIFAALCFKALPAEYETLRLSEIEIIESSTTVSEITTSVSRAFTETQETEAVTVKTATPKKETTVTSAAEFSGSYELNSVTYEQLLNIPCLDEEKAAAIIELRNTILYFSHPYELLYCEGFTEKLVAELIKYLYVEGCEDTVGLPPRS